MGFEQETLNREGRRGSHSLPERGIVEEHISRLSLHQHLTWKAHYLDHTDSVQNPPNEDRASNSPGTGAGGTGNVATA